MPATREGQGSRAPGGERGEQGDEGRGRLRARGGERGKQSEWGKQSAGYIKRALMGTAATERSAERPGDGVSPGACAVDQITPERPEERQWGARVRASLRLSRTGKSKSRGP